MTSQHNRFTITKDEWLDLINDNLVTDEMIDRIIENEKLRQNIIKLRDEPLGTPCEQIIEDLIGFTEDLKV